jgi:hypothetical protein
MKEKSIYKNLIVVFVLQNRRSKVRTGLILIRVLLQNIWFDFVNLFQKLNMNKSLTLFCSWAILLREFLKDV